MNRTAKALWGRRNAVRKPASNVDSAANGGWCAVFAIVDTRNTLRIAFEESASSLPHPQSDAIGVSTRR